MSSLLNKQNRSKNIFIIGAGLVGSLTALQLGKLGYTINLYEYRDDIRTLEVASGRSINLALSKRGRNALVNVGLEDIVLSQGLPMFGRLLHDIKGHKKISLYDAVNNESIYSVDRKKLNEILLTAAEELENVNIFFNTKLVEVDIKNGVVTLHNSKTQKNISEKPDLIIGCDGAFSTLRKHMAKVPGFNFSQTYIEHGYIELTIPPTAHHGFAMNEKYLHIWPRENFMLIALPNIDKSWTVTLFMPFKNFESIATETDLIYFFQKFFPDVIDLIGKTRLLKDFFSVKPQYLVQIKCEPCHSSDKFLLIGDAAHAIVPFYGQGMNAGFEDVTLLKTLFTEYNGDFNKILQEFSLKRCKDVHAIADLAMYNYVEMRYLVTTKSFFIRKKVDECLFRLFKSKWMPLYNTISFSQIPYSQCVENKKRQDVILQYSTVFLCFICLFFMSYLFYN